MTGQTWTWSMLLTLLLTIGPGCNDPDPVPAKTLEQGDTLCADNIDNDADGQIDCADSDCSAVLACRTDVNDLGPAHPDAGLDLVQLDLGDNGDSGQNPILDVGSPDILNIVMPPPDPPLPVDSNYYFPASIQNRVDILVVVDNSNSMEHEQINLASNFPMLIDSLVMMSGGMPDIHIGVISTDLGAGNYSLQTCEVAGGDGGKLQATSPIGGCTAPTDSWISYENGLSNVPGSGDELAKIMEAFSCISQLGTDGCGFEHQLESARRALDPQLNVNPGFIRNDALLVVLFVTDEDDCSAKMPLLFDPSSALVTDPLGRLSSFRCFEFGFSCTQSGHLPGPRENCQPAGDWLYKVADYAQFFRGLKPLGQVVLAAIAGPSEPVGVSLDNGFPALAPSCQSAMGSAVPPLRLKTVVQSFGPTGLFNPAGTTICSQDFSPALSLLGTRIAAQLGQSCLGPLTDTDPLTPQIQADCQVVEVVGNGATPVPQCATQSGACSPCPCWRANANPNCSGMGDGYSLEIARSQPPASGTTVQASCLGPAN